MGTSRPGERPSMFCAGFAGIAKNHAIVPAAFDLVGERTLEGCVRADQLDAIVEAQLVRLQPGPGQADLSAVERIEKAFWSVLMKWPPAAHLAEQPYGFRDARSTSSSPTRAARARTRPATVG
ncbi:hypothetical protein [Enteroscipio rubneri]|uniref:hypothetical protein n=1 Tax=Enteroscipio rubneri TaxID=2070686 RepID=UPI00320905EA